MSSLGNVSSREANPSGHEAGRSWYFPRQGSDSLRYERKFTCERNQHFIESIVRMHPALFREIYHRRWVNNIYLDTWRLNSREDNLVSESRHRVKVRIRWYGEFWGRVERPILELKIKRNLVNWKEQFTLAPFEVDDRLTIATIREAFHQSDLPESLALTLRKLRPALVNRYSRKYFQSADRRYRVTIDSGLTFRAINAGLCTAPASPVRMDAVILELKYGLDSAMAAGDLTQYFPFRVSRSSKYVTGIGLIRSAFGSG
jgi:hypothetical protein